MIFDNCRLIVGLSITHFCHSYGQQRWVVYFYFAIKNYHIRSNILWFEVPEMVYLLNTL